MVVPRLEVQIDQSLNKIQITIHNSFVSLFHMIAVLMRRISRS